LTFISNDDDGGGGEVRYRCTNCKRMLSGPDEKPCSKCGSPLRDIIAESNETVYITEETTTEVATLKRNYPWFIATVIVTMSAPFISAIPGLHPIFGIIIGLGFGYASLRLGKKAYILIKRIYESR
jgi:RNA polymerase subunit RPABC4/transcription elongation factor Spt4